MNLQSQSNNEHPTFIDLVRRDVVVNSLGNSPGRWILGCYLVVSAADEVRLCAWSETDLKLSKQTIKF